MGWMLRWMMLEKAEASREIWKRWEDKEGKLKLTKSEQELKSWAMRKRKY